MLLRRFFSYLFHLILVLGYIDIPLLLLLLLIKMSICVILRLSRESPWHIFMT